MDEYKPTTFEQAECARRIYNGIKSRHIACLVAGAVMHALQDPAFLAKSQDIDIENLKVLFED